jgi:hypothetical protein
MINHFGPSPADGEKSPTSTGKKLEQQKSNVTGDSGVSFKQSFKPQKISQLKDMFNKMISSRNATPSNANIQQGNMPLISTSNLLLGQNAMFGPFS